MTAATAPRLKIVCPDCRDRLVHRLITLYAAEDTFILCGGAWESLPAWLKDAHKACEKKGLAKRREVVREIREQLQ